MFCYAVLMDVSEDDVRALIDDKYDGSTENRHLLRQDMARLAAGEPLAYVIGWIPFLGLRIYLDSKPLIPRPETEWWAEELSTRAKDAKAILDLCAGSGAIGCALLKNTSAQVSFGEIDAAHEVTIRKNIEENHLDADRANVRIGDLFAPFAGMTFDIIAANPPYIPSERTLEHSVTSYEPKEALFADTDGLSVIRRIAAEAPLYMNPGGELWLECDIDNATETEKLVAAHATRAELRTDQYGRPRLVVGYY